MKVAVIGATGNAGSRIVEELASRGHQVTAIARDVSKLKTDGNIIAKSVDADDVDALTEALLAHDVVVSSLKFATSDPEKLIAAARKSGASRYIVVGGAATLTPPGSTTRIIDSGQIPAEWMPEVGGGAKFLDRLKQEPDGLDWTFLSPSMFFGPGERTGKFRLGKDELLSDENGKSHISYEDYAIALADEIEHPQHSRQRFTVGY